jgi:hypothetical protein
VSEKASKRRAKVEKQRKASEKASKRRAKGERLRCGARLAARTRKERLRSERSLRGEPDITGRAALRLPPWELFSQKFPEIPTPYYILADSR